MVNTHQRTLTHKHTHEGVGSRGSGGSGRMKFGQIIRDEQKSCLVGAQIEMFDFFVGNLLRTLLLWGLAVARWVGRACSVIL